MLFQSYLIFIILLAIKKYTFDSRFSFVFLLKDRDNLSRCRMHGVDSACSPGRQLDILRERQNPSNRLRESYSPLRRSKSIPLSSCGPYLRFLARGYHTALPFSARHVACSRLVLQEIWPANVFLLFELCTVPECVCLSQAEIKLA